MRIVFPMGGLHRGAGRQNQPPYTTPDALNVRPRDSLEGRDRGGSRPGLGIRVPVTGWSGGNAVRMLSSVEWEAADFLRMREEGFDSAEISGQWSAAPWLTAGTIPVLEDGYATADNGETRGLMFEDVNLSHGATTPQVYEMFIVPSGAQHRATYHLYMKMQDAGEPSDDSIAVTLTFDSTGTASGTIIRTEASAPLVVQLTPVTAVTPEAGWLTVVLSGTNSRDATVYWRGRQMAAVTSWTSFPSGAYQRFGFDIEHTGAIGSPGRVGHFRVWYYDTAGAAYVFRRTLVAGVGGRVYKENFNGTFSSVGSAGLLASDRNIQATERFQKLYIADASEDLMLDRDGLLIGNIVTVSATPALSNLSTINASTGSHVVVLHNPATSSGVQYAAIPYTSVAEVSGNYRITLNIPSGSPAVFTGSVRISRAPKIYDPKANTVSLWTTENIPNSTTEFKGFVPGGCKLICQYSDRLVLARPDYAPHAWFMSRRGNPRDFDYSQTDDNAAVAGALAFGGQIGDAVNALCPFSDDYLIFGCRNSLWILRGDPTKDGVIDSLSRVVGMVSAQSWCYTPEGAIVFCSNEGVYMLPPGANMYPEPVSPDKLPRSLRYINSNSEEVFMAYDTAHRGIHLYVTSLASGGVREHWWIDWPRGGFWPVQLTEDHEPTSLHVHRGMLPSSHPASHVLLGARDGNIRHYHEDYRSDSFTPFASNVVLGPFGPRDPIRDEALLAEMTAVTDADGSSVTWEVYAGATAEAALRADPQATGEFEAGDSYTAEPRVRGSNLFINLRGSDVVVTEGGEGMLTESGETIETEDVVRLPFAFEALDMQLRETAKRRRA